MKLFIIFLCFISFDSSYSRKQHLSQGHNEQFLNDEPIVARSSGVQIIQWHASSYIQSRLATTYVTSKLKNYSPVPMEFAFTALLPDEAYISNFTMVVNGRVILGQVKEATEALEAYKLHKSKNGTAGIIKKGISETNFFEIIINLEPKIEVHVMLTYEEVLEREEGVYKHVIYVHPGQIVPDLKLRVEIVENVDISELRIAPFEHVENMENGDLLEKTKNNHYSDIPVNVTNDGNSFKRIIRYEPRVVEQKDLKNQTGHFVILYDIKRDDSDLQSFQVVDGFFLHYFTPKRTRRDAILNKHIVFVLDISYSMLGVKLSQTIVAMKAILEQLNENDHFNVVTFSTIVYKWRRKSLPATGANVNLAIRYIQSLEAHGGTNIDGAMKYALSLISASKNVSAVSMIIFMTDGQPTWGETNHSQIVKNIQKVNIGDRNKFAIHTMAFGREADFHLMKAIALNNNGLARRIYEGPDADVQLKGFYKQISLPLLTNVAFEYLNDSLELDTIVQDKSAIAYVGKEHLALGKLRKRRSPSNDEINVTIYSEGKSGNKESLKTVRKVKVDEMTNTAVQSDPFAPPPTTLGLFIEKMWAYKTIKHLLENANYIEQNATTKSALTDRALNMSLHYNFVTELTSMVVTVDKVLPMKDKVKAPRHKQVRYDKLAAPVPGALVLPHPGEDECIDENEDWMPCGINCQATCRKANCTLAECGEPACGCKENFLRHEGQCILKEDCPSTECKVNQEFTNCYPVKYIDNLPVECQLTCTENALHDEECEPVCFTEFTCICKSGFVLTDNDSCISRDNCSNQTNI